MGFILFVDKTHDGIYRRPALCVGHKSRAVKGLVPVTCQHGVFSVKPSPQLRRVFLNGDETKALGLGVVFRIASPSYAETEEWLLVKSSWSSSSGSLMSENAFCRSVTTWAGSTEKM